MIVLGSRRGSLSWDHNAHYHRLVLGQLPDRCGRVLDVGCGAGELAALLARRADQVDAVDRDPGMVAAARARVPGNVRCVEGDVLDPGLGLGSYDAVVSVAVLHHLSLEVALPRLVELVRPGGVLVAVVVRRSELPRELPMEAAAVAFTNVRGAYLAGRALAGGPARPVPVAAMPVRDPELTFRQARAGIRSVLPDAGVRRLLLWRYLLTWRRPAHLASSGQRWVGTLNRGGRPKVGAMPLDGEYEPSASAWVREQVAAYEESGGARGNTLRDTGIPIVVVTMRGARTGKVRKIGLMRVEHGGEYALVASKGGAPENPGWYHNLLAHPEEVQVQDGPAPVDVTVREVTGAEREVWWERAVAVFPTYAQYQARTAREIPVLVASPRG